MSTNDRGLFKLRSRDGYMRYTSILIPATMYFGNSYESPLNNLRKTVKRAEGGEERKRRQAAYQTDSFKDARLHGGGREEKNP